MPSSKNASPRSAGADTATAVPGALFAPVQSRRAFEEICERVRGEIARGRLKPGDKLPAERELAQQFGVGRNALREALRSLEIAGILELKKGVKGGAFIRGGDSGRMDQVVADMFSLGSISVADLTEARVHILDQVVRLACVRATRADLDALEANIDRTERMTAEGRYLDRVETSREFYLVLAAAARNQVLSMMVHSLTEILMRFVYQRVAAGGPPQPRLVDKRRRFLEALRARDASTACRLMRLHLRSVHSLLLDRAKATPARAAG